ncbi:hypothetical protein I553_1684 [Mycobacterium xenopi 4042]|uniref:Uncharacterized protein n=1 Tax=Mycobacterium xenopi 4042 TaxID=1299334 RepID=X8CDL8_MYCXE|nr:hypothetical protein I553_1684 [Mycobacterium xenopi 4042]
MPPMINAVPVRDNVDASAALLTLLAELRFAVLELSRPTFAVLKLPLVRWPTPALLPPTWPPAGRRHWQPRRRHMSCRRRSTLGRTDCGTPQLVR